MAAGLPNRNGRRSTPGSSSWWGVLRDMMQVGLGLKRWLLIGACGVAVCAVGMAFVLKNVFSLFVPDVLPWHLEGLTVGALGIAMIVLGVYGLYRSLGPLVLRQQGVNSLTNTIVTRRMRERGPKVVAIGGGTGLSMLLRGLKAYTDNITAIITVADDGGSSGRLRRELGLLPPGDFRNCLVALSEEEGVVADLFQYRFDQGGGLKGHSFGNLFIAAMTDVTGSFEQALFESSKVLAVRGRIVPATVAHLSLVAELDDGSLVKGESMITARGGSIERVMIEPADAAAHPEAVEAIGEADLVVIGPGSLYTSLVPNLLVPEIAGAVGRARAQKVYVCNVATERGETEGYTVADHVLALQRHTFTGLVDVVVANGNPLPTSQASGVTHVLPSGEPPPNVSMVTADVVDHAHPTRHDASKLADLIVDVYYGKNVSSGSPVGLQR